MSCSKIPYATRQEAVEDARLIQANQKRYNRRTQRYARHKSNKKLIPYQCSVCTLWHLTSRNPKLRKKSRK